MSEQSAILSMQHLGQYLHMHRQVRIITKGSYRDILVMWD